MKTLTACLAALALTACGGGSKPPAHAAAPPVAKTTAEAEATCTPATDPYGTPPAGWAFQKATAAVRAAVVKTMPGGAPADLDVAVAVRGDKPQGLLMSTSADDVGSALADIEASARKGGAKVRHDAGVTVIDATDGGRTRAKTKGCTLVMVLGAKPSVVDRIAGAVFES